jgi:hypothetical protein
VNDMHHSYLTLALFTLTLSFPHNPSTCADIHSPPRLSVCLSSLQHEFALAFSAPLLLFSAYICLRSLSLHVKRLPVHKKKKTTTLLHVDFVVVVDVRNLHFLFLPLFFFSHTHMYIRNID